MAVRQICKASLALANKKGVGKTFGNNNIRLLTSCSNSSSLFKESRNCFGVTLVSKSYKIDGRMVSTKQPKSSPGAPTAVNMGSILEHHKYRERPIGDDDSAAYRCGGESPSGRSGRGGRDPIGVRPLASDQPFGGGCQRGIS